MNRAAPALSILLVLAGCGFFPDGGLETTQEAPAEDRAAALLTSAALRAEAALAELAQSRASENPIDARPPPSLVPAELLAEITVDWTGPLDTLARRLAEEVGWDYVEAGPVPAVPPIVEIHATSSPVILVLRDAGIQAAETAALTVDAQARQVRIDWSTTQGAPI